MSRDTTSTDTTSTTTNPVPAAPFTMVTGDPAALVCEGDVCRVPGLSPA